MPRKPSAANAPKRSTSNVRRTIGANIKARRLTLGWSQQELADRFGVSRATVSQYEIGTGEVNAGDLPRLAEILGVGLRDFFGPTPPVSPTPLPNAGDPSTESSVFKAERVDEYIKVVCLDDQEDGSTILVLQNDAQVANDIGTVADAAERAATLALLGSIVALPPEHRETVRRIVDAMQPHP